MATTQASKKALIAVLPKRSGYPESLHKITRRGQRCPVPLRSDGSKRFQAKLVSAGEKKFDRGVEIQFTLIDTTLSIAISP
jgi:hypothetical protein